MGHFIQLDPTKRWDPPPGYQPRSVSEERQCSLCSFFRVWRGHLRQMDRGQRVLGTCTAWNTPIHSDAVCSAFTEGESDVAY